MSKKKYLATGVSKKKYLVTSVSKKEIPDYKCEIPGYRCEQKEIPGYRCDQNEMLTDDTDVVAGLLNIDLVRNTVQDLLDIVGLDATEQQCESGCHGLILGDETTLLHTFCTPICRS